MTTPCSEELLESALAGDLPPEREQLLHRHLEECQACTTSLERMAGGADLWREAAVMFAGDEVDDALSARDEWSNIDFTVEHLEPADEPGVLGRLGGYDVLEIIGRGGMGVVLKGFDPELKRCVAIKVLSPHLALSSLARKRFAREAQAAAAVVHANVLAIHQVQPAGRLPFLVMPLVAGESLAQRLTAQGRLELKEVLRIGMQAAAGLSAAHEQGLVHRDVKPANILLEKGVERAVLTDFGLARAADDVSMTRWGIIAGTPQYMSPEQARGEPVDGRSDLFSLGCVLYEMATGVSPFRADSTLATLRRLIDDPPPAMASKDPELPPWFIGIVGRLLEKEPSKRFASAKEVSELLEGCLAHLQQPATVPLPKVAGTLRVPSAPNSPLLPGEGQGVRAAASSRRFRNVFTKGTLAMLTLLGISLFAVGVATTNPPDISGQWQGPDWGQVVLKQTAPGQYAGSYTDTVGKGPGRIELKWSRIERQYNGTWSEGEDRFGDLSVGLADNEIRGALTTDPRSKINPATPRLAPFVWTRAAPLAGGRESKSGTVRKAPAEAKNSGFYFVTYPVGDLVFQPAAVVDVPAPPSSGPGSPLPPPTAPSAAGVPAPPSGPGAVVQLPSDKADFDSITELIFTTIAPDSWLQKGGKGTISHHVANTTITVLQTREVHDEIVDLLEQLRRMQNIQVVLKTRFIELDARYAGRLDLNGELAALDAHRTAVLLKRVEDDRHTWQAPMMTLFDGQAARYSNQFHGASPEHCQVQATVDENRTMVKLSLTTDGYSKEKPTTVRVKDGETAVVNITFQNDRANNEKPPASGKKVVIMMITPQIVVQEEEEDRIDVPLPPAKAGTQTGKKKTPIPAGAAAVPASQNFLKNSGVENGGEKPDNWEQGAAIDGVRYSWCKSVAFEGKASLYIEKTAERYFPIAQWSQTVNRQGDRPALRVSTQVKAEKMTKAVLDVLFLDEQDNWVSHKWAVYIGGKADRDLPASHDWKLYCGTMLIPKEAKKICIGLQVYGPGKVWFDDVRAGFLDDAGEEKVSGTVSESVAAPKRTAAAAIRIEKNPGRPWFGGVTEPGDFGVWLEDMGGNGRWWRPDGTLTEKSPNGEIEEPGVQSSHQKHKQGAWRTFFVRVLTQMAEPCGLKYEITPCEELVGPNTFGLRALPHSVTPLGFAGWVPETARTVTVRVGISAGPWEDVWSAKYDETGHVQNSSSGRVGDLGGELEAHELGSADILITNVKRGHVSPPSDDVRVIGMRRDGSVVDAPTHFQGPKQKLNGLIALFADASLKQFKEIKLQRRPYTWIEFRDVAVRPNGGKRTEKASPTVPSTPPATNAPGADSASGTSWAERINKALDAYDIAMAHFRNGRCAEDEPDAALIALLEARLQAAEKKAERIELLRKLVDMRGKYEHIIEAQYKFGRGLRSEADWTQAKAARLDAESRLAKEEANNGVGTANAENRSDSADPRASAEAAAAYERGNAHEQNKQYADAVADYSKALEIDPKDYSARFNRALVYEYVREYDKAIADYTKVIEGDTDFSRNVDSKDECLAMTHHYRGRAYQWYKRDNAKAVADFTEALRLDPKIEMVHYRRGRAYNALKEYAKAVADFKVALDQDPDYPNLLCAYAWQLATCPDPKFRDGKKALELARKANEKFKWEVADQVETLAAANAETGQFDEAVKWQKKAIELFATKSKAHPEDDKAMRQRLKQYEARKPYRAE